MSDRYRFADWSTEALLDYEERLYDDECSGVDTWSTRDEVLWELNRRDFGLVSEMSK